MNGPGTLAYLKKICAALDGTMSPRSLRRAALTLALPVAGLSVTGVSLGQDQPMYGVPFERTCQTVLENADHDGNSGERCVPRVLECRCQLLRPDNEVDSCKLAVCDELSRCIQGDEAHSRCFEQACAAFDLCGAEPAAPPPEHPDERRVRNAGCQGG